MTHPTNPIKQITIYETTDGTRFHDPGFAQVHQNKLELKKMIGEYFQRNQKGQKGPNGTYSFNEIINFLTEDLSNIHTTNLCTIVNEWKKREM